MNENNQPTNEQLELETQEIAHWADLADAVERLEKNPDWKKVIEEGYMKQKALDSVSLLAVPDIKAGGKRTDVMEDLVAISNLQYHLMMIKQLGAGAKADLAELEGPEVEDEA